MRDADADRLWQALVDFPLGEKTALTIQAHLLPSKAAAFEEQATRLGLATVCHAGDGILIGRFADQAKAEDVSGRLARLADWARQNHGSLVLVNSEANLPATGSALEGNSRATSLMRELKVAFDPAGLLNPGKSVASL